MKNKHGLLRAIGHAAWLPFGIRNRLVNRFVNNRKTDSQPYTASLNGYVYNGNLNIYIDWHVYYFGVYERGFLNFLKQLALRAGTETVFFDIGANVGHHTLFMAPYCKSMLSFEPNPDSYRRLVEKINDNKLTHIRAFEFGLSNTNDTLGFYVPVMTNTGSASFEDRSSWGHKKMEAIVKIGDEVVQAAGITRLDLVKIDVEGFEKNVFEGLKNTLKQFRPMVFFEMENNTIEKFSSVQELFALFPEGYQFVKVSGAESSKASIRPFSFVDDGANVLAFPEEKRNLIYG